MYNSVNPLFLWCNSPLHAGAGAGLGVIDLPIQREKHTDFPKIEGSSLKGSIREYFSTKDPQNAMIKSIFGSEEDAAAGNTQAGAFGLSDARLLLFPVKSVKGVFAWVTCPRVLNRLVLDFNSINPELPLPEIPAPNTTGEESSLLLAGDRVVLEEYAHDVDIDEKVNKLGQWLSVHFFGENANSYWTNKIKTDIVVLSDDDFKDYVLMSTEVITRTKISSETGTVEQGALFNEEYLPTESLLYTLVFSRNEFKRKENGNIKEEEEEPTKEQVLLNYFQQTLGNGEGTTIQLGGNYTLGKGLINTRFVRL